MMKQQVPICVLVLIGLVCSGYMSLTAIWRTAANSPSASLLHVTASVIKLYNLVSSEAVR